MKRTTFTSILDGASLILNLEVSLVLKSIKYDKTRWRTSFTSEKSIFSQFHRVVSTILGRDTIRSPLIMRRKGRGPQITLCNKVLL